MFLQVIELSNTDIWSSAKNDKKPLHKKYYQYNFLKYLYFLFLSSFKSTPYIKTSVMSVATLNYLRTNKFTNTNTYYKALFGNCKQIRISIT